MNRASSKKRRGLRAKRRTGQTNFDKRGQRRFIPSQLRRLFFFLCANQKRCRDFALTARDNRACKPPTRLRDALPSSGQAEWGTLRGDSKLRRDRGSKAATWDAADRQVKAGGSGARAKRRRVRQRRVRFRLMRQRPLRVRNLNLCNPSLRRRLPLAFGLLPRYAQPRAFRSDSCSSSATSLCTSRCFP